MKSRGQLLLITFLALFAWLALLSGTVAAAPQEITMTPTSNSPLIDPGATYNGKFEILDQGQSSYSFQIYASPYHVVGEDYTPDFTALPNSIPVDKWFTLPTGTPHINAGHTMSINYSISVPSGTVPGGYYAVIFAQTKYPKTANSITLNERVGEIFYIQVAGPVTQKGQVLSWQSSIVQKPPLTAILRLENNGGLHYPATITVDVRDIFGRSKYSLYTVKEVLPQTVRRVTVTWDKTPSIGIFKITGTVNILKQNHPLSTKWVLVMSQGVRIGLLAILGAIVLFGLMRFVFRRRKKRKASRRRS